MNLTKPELSTLELHAVVQELQPLRGAKIDQIYQAEQKELFIQLHQTGTGKHILRILSGKLLYLTKQKPTMATPSTFCMQLRKHLDGAVIREISQVGAQRIVQIELIKSDLRYMLFIELFSKGNMVLSDDKRSIIALLERQTWQSREVKPGVEYILPPLVGDIFTLEKKGFEKMIKESKKDKIASAGATELGIGGLYAEEICARAGCDKSKSPKELTKKDIEALWKAVKAVREETEKPKGTVSEGNILSPITLTTKNPVRELSTFNEALDTFLSTSKIEQEREKKEQQYQQKIADVQHIMEQQERTLKELEKKTSEEAAKGDLIYQHYTDIKKFLDAVEKTKVLGGWDGVKEMLSKMKKIKEINMKEKKIKVDV